jgi:hypothetical protein
MAIERDDKDWTWVLQRPCPECGFTAAEVPPEQVGARLRAELPTWRGVLAFPWAGVRPDDTTWSPTEYACHIRDVATLYAFRLQLMLTQDDPFYANWSSDDAAVEGDYSAQDPETVLPDLQREVEMLAGAFDAVSDDDWSRTGRRSDGASFTISTFAQYLLHDVVHHGWDVTRPRGIDGRFASDR